MPLQEHEVYLRIGDAGFAKLAAEFYRRIPTDTVLGARYPVEDLKGAEERLRSFLIYRFGGPADYYGLMDTFPRQKRFHYVRSCIRHNGLGLPLCGGNRADSGF